MVREKFLLYISTKSENRSQMSSTHTHTLCSCRMISVVHHKNTRHEVLLVDRCVEYVQHNSRP